MEKHHRDILVFRRPDEPDADANRRRPAPDTDGCEAVAGDSTAMANDTPRDEHDRHVLQTSFSSSGRTRSAGPQPYQWMDLREEQPPLPVRVQLGKARIPAVADLRKLSGKIIALDQTQHATVEIVAGGQVIGYGEVVVVQGKLAIEIKHMVEARQRRSA